MKVRPFIVAMTLAMLVALGGEASAQGVGVGASVDVEQIPARTLHFHQPKTVFSAKFLCGTIRPDPANLQAPFGGVLAPGTYMTTINFNFIGCCEDQAFDAFVSPAGGETSFLGTLSISPPINSGRFTCLSMIPGFQPSDLFSEGFLVITIVEKSLRREVFNVVGVYTFKNVEPDTPSEPRTPP